MQMGQMISRAVIDHRPVTSVSFQLYAVPTLALKSFSCTISVHVKSPTTGIWLLIKVRRLRETLWTQLSAVVTASFDKRECLLHGAPHLFPTCPLGFMTSDHAQRHSCTWVRSTRTCYDESCNPHMYCIRRPST